MIMETKKKNDYNPQHYVGGTIKITSWAFSVYSSHAEERVTTLQSSELSKWLYKRIKMKISPYNQSRAYSVQRVKGHQGSGKHAVRPNPTKNNQEKVVEVEKPKKKHDSKVLKEYWSKQLFCIFHDVYQVFCGLLKGRFTWGIPQNLFNCMICWI